MVVKLGTGSVAFVYSCPDEAPVRQKMTYSTAKVTLLGQTASLGLTFSKVVEIRQVMENVEKWVGWISPYADDL